MSDEKIKVVVLGAGMAGILTGIKLKEAGLGNAVIYEKAERIGGTWRDNTYPGLTCDTPSHHYSYSFARNPGWSRYLSPGLEIQDYFESVVSEHNLEDMIRFEHEATKAVFESGKWHLEFSNGHTDSADILIAATGVLRVPKVPEISGMDSFKGALFHSSQWDHSVPLDGKKSVLSGTAPRVFSWCRRLPPGRRNYAISSEQHNGSCR